MNDCVTAINDYVPAPAVPVAPKALPGRDLLIVDPDARFAAVLERYLEERGWNVAWVADTRSALRALDAFAPRVIVTELDGEDADGFELLEALGALKDRPPVIACTRNAAADSLVPHVLRSFGINVVLSRPFRFDTLSAVLEALLEQSEAQRPEKREHRAYALDGELLCQA